MNRFMCILLAAAFFLTAIALAEAVPSRSTADMIRIEASAENLPPDSGFFIATTVDDEEYQNNLSVCREEISKLFVSESIETYFGAVTDSEGNEVSLKEMLGSEMVNIFEFCPLVAGEYEAHYGKVSARMQFATPYAKDEKVVVLVGLVTLHEDAAQEVAWTAYEGVGVESQDAEESGCIQVELDTEIILAIQESTAILAVASK